jgi:hypothetical protein
MGQSLKDVQIQLTIMLINFVICIRDFSEIFHTLFIYGDNMLCKYHGGACKVRYSLKSDEWVGLLSSKSEM